MVQTNAETFTVCQWWTLNEENLTDKFNMTILGKMNWPKIVFSAVKTVYWNRSFVYTQETPLQDNKSTSLIMHK